MRTIDSLSLYVLPAVAAILLGAVAHADPDNLFAQGGPAAIAAQQGTDAAEGVSRNTELHWTARIGSGTAAQPGQAGEPVGDVTYAEATSVRHAEPHWTSLIGTGVVSGEPPLPQRSLPLEPNR